MTYTWHTVTKNIHAENLGLKFNRRLDKIKMLLQHFPQNSVHLNIALEKNPKKDLYVAALTLRLPSNILHSEKSAEKMMTAFDKAADALVREIESLKAELRGDFRWEQKERRAVLHEDKSSRFGALPEGEPAEEVPGVGGELLEEHRRHLLNYVTRQIARDEAAGRIPAARVKPESVVEDVVRQALTSLDQKSPDQTHKVWFYLLARQEISRRYQAIRTEEFEQAWPNGAPTRAQIMRHKFEPPSSEPLAAFLPVPRPDLQAQLLKEVQDQATHWDDEERAVLDLRFFEGFDPEETAVITRMSTDRVAEITGNLESKIRETSNRIAEAEMERVGG